MADEKIKQIEKYVRNGWKLVPIPRGKKAPEGVHAKGWQTNSITDPTVIGDGNCGILLGEPSKWLVDIDFDWREAADLAKDFLPETGAIFGRETNKSSHFLYYASGAKTRQFQIGKKEDGGMILELRSTGTQTIFPPSIHKGTGQTIEWEKEEEPLEISITELEPACRMLAAASLIAKNWGDGSRQSLALAVSGVMLKAGISLDKTKHLIESVCNYVGDNEAVDRIHCATVTQEKIEKKMEVAGYQSLVEILGEKTATAISRFFKTPVTKDTAPEGTIFITDSPSKDVANRAWHQIDEEQKDGPTLFRFGNEIARMDESIEILDKEGLWQELCDRLDWVRRASGNRMVKCDPPIQVITYMRKQKSSSIPLPRINSTSKTPVMCPNGNIHAHPGYSKESKIYNLAELSVPKISETPTDEERKMARKILCEIFCDFPFVHDSDHTHALAMTICSFVRPMIKGPTPLHLINKPRQGTGATLLAEVVTMLKMGNAAAAQPACMREEEWQKTILSNLINGPEFIFIDNVKAIYSNSLALALTGQNFTARKLGGSEMLDLPVQCIWIMTGNNVEMGQDFPRRILDIRLDANLEDPSKSRQFRHPNLKGYIEENRGRIVWAILTMARAWVAAGKPSPSKTLASFNNWAFVVGGILEHAGFENFLNTPIERIESIDPFIEQEIEFVRCWLAHCKIDDERFNFIRAKSLINLCEICDLEYGQERNGYCNATAFSQRFMKHLADRVFNLHTISGEKICVKVVKGKKRGNGVWGIEVFKEFKGVFEETTHADWWSGAKVDT